MKKAMSIEAQIELLESRGLTVNDREKAKEVLLDIGLYRLGFYLFPFEKAYPRLQDRSHEYIEGATFEDAVRLYYFDFDLRLLLMRYLNRIEIAFRIAMVQLLSNKYKDNSIWFVDKSVVNRQYMLDFEKKVYTSDFRRNPIIHRHHQKHPNDRFAPAWKTLEFMTFGAVLKLYEQLKAKEDKMLIAHHFGIRQVVTFESYMNTVRQIRNACAHGQVLFDLHLTVRLKRGPATILPSELGNIVGALRVVNYMMKQISENRAAELQASINTLYKNLCALSPKLRTLIIDFSIIHQ